MRGAQRNGPERGPGGSTLPTRTGVAFRASHGDWIRISPDYDQATSGALTKPHSPAIPTHAPHEPGRLQLGCLPIVPRETLLLAFRFGHALTGNKSRPGRVKV